MCSVHIGAAFNGPFGSMCIVQSRVTFLWERCCVLSCKFYGVTYTSSGLKSKIVNNQTSLSFSMLPVIHLIVIVIVQPWYSFLKNFTFPLFLKLSFQSSLSCTFEFHSFSFLQLSCNLLAKKKKLYILRIKSAFRWNVTKTKVISKANQRNGRWHNEPMRSQSN